MAKMKIEIKNDLVDEILKKIKENDSNNENLSDKELLEQNINKFLENELKKEKEMKDIEKFIFQYIYFIKNNYEQESCNLKINALKQVLKDLFKNEIEKINF